jgi:integrase
VSVYRHGRRWWYSFSFRGIRYRESTVAPTREAALQLEATRRAELATVYGSKSSPGCSPRFLDFAYNDFRQWCAVEHRDRPSTNARYMRSIKALSAFFGGRTLGAINSGHVEHYKMYRSQQPRKNGRDGRLVTPAAVNRDLAVLRILFNYAIRLGKLTENPVSQIKFFREPQNHIRVLSPAEEERYLACAGPLLQDIAVLMLHTGMRPGEIYNLQVHDVDLGLRSVHVPTGKTANASRHIPLTRRALDVLARRTAEAETEWLFPCPYDPNKPIAEARKAHDGAVRRSGIHHFRLYDLRHTALTRMALAGIDLPTLKELAGHSQIQMTMRYVHPTPEHKRRAIEKFEKASVEFIELPRDCRPS